VRLDRIQGRKHPLRCPSSRIGVAGQQCFRPLADMEDDGARLEQRQAVLLQHGNLSERLHGAILRRVLLAPLQRPDFVREPRLLHRPAGSDVLDVSPGANSGTHDNAVMVIMMHAPAVGRRRNPAAGRTCCSSRRVASRVAPH
jgi:hypothetical protein